MGWLQQGRICWQAHEGYGGNGVHQQRDARQGTDVLLRSIRLKCSICRDAAAVVWRAALHHGAAALTEPVPRAEGHGDDLGATAERALVELDESRRVAKTGAGGVGRSQGRWRLLMIGTYRASRAERWQNKQVHVCTV